MLHLLCLVPRVGVHEEVIAEYLDSLDKAFEWMDLPEVSMSRLITVKYDSMEEAGRAMAHVPSNLFTTFTFSKKMEA